MLFPEQREQLFGPGGSFAAESPSMQGGENAGADGHEGVAVGELGAEEGGHGRGRYIRWTGAAEDEDVQGGTGGDGILFANYRAGLSVGT